MLLTHLPPGTRTAAALGVDADAWTRPEQLLAGLFDAVQRLAWVTICANSKPEDRPALPDPLPRPGLQAPAEVPFAERMRWLAGL